MNDPIKQEVMGITSLVSNSAMSHHSGMPVSAADYQMNPLGRLPDPIDRSDSPHSVHSMHSMHNRYSPRPGEMSVMGYAPPPMHSMGPDGMSAVPMPGMAPTSMPSQYPTPDYKQDPMVGWQQQVQQPPPHMAMHMQQQQQPQPQPQQQPVSTGPVKAHPCRTCGKGFARRSDLARHERIHSGHRPHACDYPGCGKQFIQRSALTVHTRVHTGEKPHMCETCGKPFGDSSSLARHRRTHSGRRPYKCPYANCQKTFTRRTTLTRHQNHHVGTIEEAAAATVAALASRPNVMKMPRSSDIDPMSQTGSPASTPSPNNRPLSMSPSIMDASRVGPNSHVDFQQYQPMPPHLRSDMGYAPMRPTSHPTSYPPPSTLEPSLEQQQQQQGQIASSQPGSVVGSPHMSHVSWQSGAVGSGPNSPGHPAGGFVYPEPGSYTSQLYYNASAGDMRRDHQSQGMVNLS